MSTTTPTPESRYAVVSPTHCGPYVSFWPNHTSVIHLLAYYSNMTWHQSPGFSVWHRRSAKARWVCVSS